MMNRVKKIQQKSKYSNLCMALTVIFFVGYSAMFITLFHHQYYMSDIGYLADLLYHIEFFETGENMYSLMYVLLGLLDKLPSSGVGIAVFLTGLLLLGVYATKCLLQYLMPHKDKWVVWVYAWICNMFFKIIIPIIPMVGTFRYEVVLNFNVYHNPTYIAMKPFAILSVLYFLTFIKTYHKERISAKQWLVFTGLMLLTTAFKPNFIVGFSLAVLCVLIIDFVKNRGKNILNYILVGTAVLPSIALTFLQQSQLFNDNSHIRIGFMTGLKAMDEYPLLTVILSMVFPIVILIYSYRDVFKDKLYAFGLLQMLTNLAITFFVYEDGPRLNHGNFLWSSYFAVGIFCAVSMYKFNKLVEENNKGGVIISSSTLGAHFMGWINYVFDLLNGGRPF
ncbi:MAG: hypothetical protein IJE16_09200 [Ruminococcus sp.]|nr:hypothetical protein [Ruminococcus sp.]